MLIVGVGALGRVVGGVIVGGGTKVTCANAWSGALKNVPNVSMSMSARLVFKRVMVTFLDYSGAEKKRTSS